MQQPITPSPLDLLLDTVLADKYLVYLLVDVHDKDTILTGTGILFSWRKNGHVIFFVL
jgi:hypothetical protein